MEGLCELFEKLKLDAEQARELDLGAADSIITALQSKNGEVYFLFVIMRLCDCL